VLPGGECGKNGLTQSQRLGQMALNYGDWMARR
jgi:hypothetical protein